MKKIFLLLLAALCVGCACFWIGSNAKFSTKKIDDKHIYFFSQERCPHCHNAKEYISKNYVNVKIEYRDIATRENQAGFVACAEKFNLDKESWGTPLICMGQNVILGWDDKKQALFDEYVKAFQ